MNLQSEISPELWEVVVKSYDAEHYTNAINDAIRYLFDVIKEKSGVEDDGAGLVGQALGGPVPKLQLNKLQTESEKMEQKGFQDILRGVYSGIRNPRSHERRSDSSENAEAIICFVNYLLSVITKAKEPFTVQEWISRVYDEFFVESANYAQELVAEIPERKRFDSLINLYVQRNDERRAVLRLVFHALYDTLEEAQIKQFLQIVSDELRLVKDPNDIRLHLAILKPEFWQKLDKIVRMRLEQILLNLIKSGQVDKDVDEDFESKYVCTSGSVGTWAARYVPYFMDKYSISWLLLTKISESSSSQNYVARYFLVVLPLIVEESDCSYFIDEICKAVIEAEGVSLLAQTIKSPHQTSSQAFQKDIKDRLKEMDENVYQKVFPELSDGEIPF